MDGCMPDNGRAKRPDGFGANGFGRVGTMRLVTKSRQRTPNHLCRSTRPGMNEASGLVREVSAGPSFACAIRSPGPPRREERIRPTSGTPSIARCIERTTERTRPSVTVTSLNPEHDGKATFAAMGDRAEPPKQASNGPSRRPP